MSNHRILAVITALALCGACNSGKQDPMKTKITPPHQQSGHGAMAGSEQSALPPITGVVVETIDAAEYTYVSVNTGKATVWAASPKIALKKGDTVSFDPAMPMENYVSKTLKKTFPLVYFTDGIRAGGDRTLAKIKMGNEGACPAQSAKSPHAGVPSPSPAGVFDFSGITKPSNSKTIVELFAQKKNLSGKKVTLRGIVVKANYGILGKTWLHLQDGTGKDGCSDITVTTIDSKPKTGNVVLVEGTLATDKKLGHGYDYPVIVEDAKVAIEK